MDTREDTSKIISKMAKNKELVLSLYKRTKFEVRMLLLFVVVVVVKLMF